MAADDLQALREKLQNCAEPGKSIALLKRIKALEGAIPKPVPIQKAPESLQVPEPSTDMTETPPRPYPI